MVFKWGSHPAEQLLAEQLLDEEHLLAEQLLAEQLLDAGQLEEDSIRTQNTLCLCLCRKRTISHRRLARTAVTNLEFLLLHPTEKSSHVHITERVLYTEVQRKGSVAYHRDPAAIGFDLPIRSLFLTPDAVLATNWAVKDQTFANNGIDDLSESLLVAHAWKGPGCFRCLYRHRFRRLCAHCLGGRSVDTVRPLASPPA